MVRSNSLRHSEPVEEKNSIDDAPPLDELSLVPLSTVAPEEHMWEPSPSPEESWSDAEGANEDGEWPVKGIVGEEIRLDGTSRYEVKWGNWYRWDGSNTTWETRVLERPELIKRWNRKQRRMRCTLAETNLDMDVPWPDDAIHKRRTYQRKQAYDEKLEKKLRGGRTSTAEWDAEVEAAYGRVQGPERGETNAKLRVRRVNPTPTAGPSPAVSAHSMSLRRNEESSPALTASSRDQSISSGPPARWTRRAQADGSSSPRSTTTTPLARKGSAAPTPNSAGPLEEPESTRRALPFVIVSQPTLRGRVSSAWNKAAKEAKAATVRISPKISDDSFPRSLRNFEYLERGYVFCDESLQETFNVLRGAFTKCDCTACVDAPNCPCQDLSEIYELEGKRNVSAYSKGLFTFEIPRGVEVIECNKYCECGVDCGNRVAQRPRSVGVEIFDTVRCGWGVRTLDNTPRGKVLGTYTGMLIRREDAHELPEEHQRYLFDLDSTEVKDSENQGDKYTVDSYEYGNWTRFVNHSCRPNMRVYCVVYDTIPYVNMPYVAFVALTDIRAGTELTIDYCPYAEEDRKGKQRAQGEECRCGSEGCRGWFRM